jgi:hypothetical protein
MPAALRATGYVIQIVDPFDLERDMPAALDKGEVAARIGDLRQIDQLAPFNPFELSHGLSLICGSVVVSIVYHFEVVCQSHMRISPSERQPGSFYPLSAGAACGAQERHHRQSGPAQLEEVPATPGFSYDRDSVAFGGLAAHRSLLFRVVLGRSRVVGHGYGLSFFGRYGRSLPPE